MSEYPPEQATSPATLEQQILDSRIAKSEAEWWAKREIEELRAQVSALQAKVHLCAGYDALEAENARLKGIAANLVERIGCGCGGDYGLCRVCRAALEELAALKEGK